MNQLLRWGLGFTFAAPAAAPLLAQGVGQSNPNGAPMWTLVVLPLLAMLGNALGGVLLEFMKGAIALWRAKVRSRIRAMGEDPDSQVISSAPESTGPIDLTARQRPVDPAARETRPPSSG
jgi:hypothetical protein